MTTIRGFSMLELLVTIAIVAILMSLALPTYQQHSKKIHRLDGQNKLTEVMHLQQSFYARHLRYSDRLADDLNLPAVDGKVPSDRGFYAITAETCEDSLDVCVRLVATPLDETQETLTLDALGRRTPAAIW